MRRLQRLHLRRAQLSKHLMSCRLKDLNSKAPKELKAYAECLDYYRCGSAAHLRIQQDMLRVSELCCVCFRLWTSLCHFHDWVGLNTVVDTHLSAAYAGVD